jgi:hypothetical protein
VDSIERRAIWLAHQVAPSLALVTDAYGLEWLRAVIADGERRVSDADRKRLRRPAPRPRVLP